MALFAASSLVSVGHHDGRTDNRIVEPYGIPVVLHVPVLAGYEPVPSPQHCAKGSPLGTVFYSEDFESASHGYSFVSTPLSPSANNLWNRNAWPGPGPDAGHSGPSRLHFGSPSTGNYDAGHVAGTAQSPWIAIPASDDLVLSFASKWQVEWLKGYDHLWVELQDSSGRTRLLCSNNALDRGDPAGAVSTSIVPSCSPHLTNPCPPLVQPEWEQRFVALPSDVAGTDVRIRFTFDSSDDKANPYMGWMIDDVRIGQLL